MLATNGIAQAAQPALWQPYDAARADILRESRPAAQLAQSAFPATPTPSPAPWPALAAP
jgi:hypothetical protein